LRKRDTSGTGRGRTRKGEMKPPLPLSPWQEGGPAITSDAGKVPYPAAKYRSPRIACSVLSTMEVKEIDEG
jgi:hypothetical protein